VVAAWGRPPEESGLSSNLNVDLRRIGDVSIVEVHGEIDLTTFAEVETALGAARDGARSVVLDLRPVEFMDTSGLRLVIQEQHRADAGGYRFAVVRGSHIVQRLFEIAGLPSNADLFVDAPTPAGSGDRS
jgi:anti-sigma B factor antagonist